MEESKYKDLQSALLNYRNTPLKGMGYSPSELLNSRLCKTKVPTSVEVLYPKLCENVVKRMQEKRESNEKHYNRNAKILRPLKSNSDVTTFDHLSKSWESAKIVDEHHSPRSYMLQDKNATLLGGTDMISGHLKNKPYSDSSDSVVTSENITENKPDVHVPFQNGQSSLGDRSHDKTSNSNNQLAITRSGRTVKKPDRLDL